ncbi:hypothetical protein, partial [Rahnella aceris]
KYISCRSGGWCGREFVIGRRARGDIRDKEGKTDQINQMIPPLPTMAFSSGNASGTPRSAVGKW